MSSAGLSGTWNAQGEEAARWMALLLNVEITRFDLEFDPQVQRAKFNQLSMQSWDLVAV